MQEFDNLLSLLVEFTNVIIVDSQQEEGESWINFRCLSEASLAAISSQLAEIQDFHNCKFMVYTNQEEPSQVIYQIVFNGPLLDQSKTILIFSKMLKNFLETGSTDKAKFKELGLPDLSLVTIRQMAMELKQRQNLCFAIVWIEDNNRDNIAIEGSGNPTQLVGMLSRGVHMAIEWADKSIKFYKPKNE